MAPGDLVFMQNKRGIIQWRDRETEAEVGDLFKGDAVVITGEPTTDLYDPYNNTDRMLIPVLTKWGKGFVWQAAFETR